MQVKCVHSKFINNSFTSGVEKFPPFAIPCLILDCHNFTDALILTCYSYQKINCQQIP
jgi:hypothetical protein